MKALIKETTLTDGSKVFDVNIFADNRGASEGAKTILTCTDKRGAENVMIELERLVKNHTIESFEDVTL